MTNPIIQNMLNKSQLVLGEGAVIERLRRNSGLELDDRLVNAAFIYDPRAREAQDKIIRQYVDIGQKFELPILLSTPTWRASMERIEQAGYGNKDVNGDNVRYLQELKRSYGSYGSKILISALMSCRGDAYKPEEALTIDEAREFHAWQVGKLALPGVDFILAATLPAFSEAKGMAQALADAGVPYILSFVLRPTGTLLDGTPIKQCVKEIDGSVDPAPLAYMVNCTHASNFRAGYIHPENSSELARNRIIGLLANTSSLSPEELDNCEGLQAEAPADFGTDLAELRRDFGLKVLGGCCGSDDRHIAELARNLLALA